MRSHKLIGHTADIRLHVEGDTLEELFTAALEGMNGIIKIDACKNELTTEHKIEIGSADSTALLIDFLSAVLTETHINRHIFCEVTFEQLNETKLKATLKGLKVDGFDEDIKAVTFHEANIIKNPKGNFETIIVFDI